MPANEHLCTRCAAIIYQDGRILLAGHEDAAGEPCLMFPGGLKREGESPEECAARQAQEETGLLVRIQSLAYELLWDLPLGRRYECYFVAYPVGGTLRGDLDPANPSDEPHPLVWVDADSLLGVPCRPTELMYRLPDDLLSAFRGAPYPAITLKG